MSGMIAMNPTTAVLQVDPGTHKQTFCRLKRAFGNRWIHFVSNNGGAERFIFPNCTSHNETRIVPGCEFADAAARQLCIRRFWSDANVTLSRRDTITIVEMVRILLGNPSAKKPAVAAAAAGRGVGAQAGAWTGRDGGVGGVGAALTLRGRPLEIAGLGGGAGGVQAGASMRLVTAAAEGLDSRHDAELGLGDQTAVHGHESLTLGGLVGGARTGKGGAGTGDRVVIGDGDPGDHDHAVRVAGGGTGAVQLDKPIARE